MINEFNLKSLYKIAGMGAVVALTANILDVVLGFGSSEVMTYGTRSALDWFALFEDSRFKGLYSLGIFNIVYMIAMIPLYFALVVVHRKKQFLFSLASAILFLVSMSMYISNNAAIPMFELSERYSAATIETQKSALVAAGEAVLATGEDFTPGAFIGLFLSGVAAIMISVVMLKGGIFSSVNAWIGIIGFTSLSLFIVIATFVPLIYYFAFYVFGSLGGLLALAWFTMVAFKLFILEQVEPPAQNF